MGRLAVVGLAAGALFLADVAAFEESAEALPVIDGSTPACSAAVIQTAFNSALKSGNVLDHRGEGGFTWQTKHALTASTSKTWVVASDGNSSSLGYMLQSGATSAFLTTCVYKVAAAQETLPTSTSGLAFQTANYGYVKAGATAHAFAWGASPKGESYVVLYHLSAKGTAEVKLVSTVAK